MNEYQEQRRKEAEARTAAARLVLAEWLRFAPVPEPPPNEKAYCHEDFYTYKLNDLKERWEQTGIGARHGEPVTNTCAGWVKTFQALRAKLGTGFIYCLIGQRGTGKTQLASDLCRVVVENFKKSSYHSRDARYTTGMNLFLQIRATFKGGETESEADILQKYAQPDLLVLDEIQERTGSEFEDRVSTLLIDERYREKRDTLLIGNLSASDVPGLLGPSITSRLNECGGVIVADWKSFREVVR